ncbi:hypothetical protein ACOXXX_01865 [Thalassococcus sp. BH17M4-6]|uniref:hypothetical protein n=1 Tax=Thalassococcus sp. BH17M4-6 TaxID=3413148 RepID=UPI003BBD9605
MPVTINEIETEVNAFDPSALLTEEVLRIMAARVAQEIENTKREDRLRDRDTAITSQRRQVE